jgi:hypothetical protein
MSFFWGGGKMSWIRYLSIHTFCLHNPGWEVYLYISKACRKDPSWESFEEQDFATYEGDNWLWNAVQLPQVTVEVVDLPENLDPVHQCDLYQWKVLYEHGGWYSDMDILYMHPMDDIQHKVGKYDMCAPLPCNDFTIGFLGAVPGLTFYKALYESCANHAEPSSYQDYGTHKICHILKIDTHSKGVDVAGNIQDRYNHRVFVPSPGEDVYPWNWRGIEQIWNYTHTLPPSQIGIHWFAGSPISQKFNKLLNPNTWKDYPCTFTKHLHERSKVPGIWEENSPS